ncbi:PTS-dependent dihydroxyacetone kinase phosphotransferase subunit DhaM [Nonomuraea pusilla]|uniref:PTS-EIIA-like component DhaM of the dihydroxyacetone kinase DhaKLM complex n=1 Tax=Nonomuraea pusilla TaxID=46177 RepID=A0A1H7P6J2_9ACTN|nr:phosphoenolpyruvate--protein phosphotransferase [Nonomuraea pusilla]SEL31008.1 PTS-EIIA-like component DhaM of the dihydroxyacetone kinase DhaKLM complex [Nonomuraea pusilla]
MVGLVLVAHSAGLAVETAALARSVAGEDTPIAAAGGAAAGGLGTSVDVIEKALRTVEQGDGVVVIADLGSSVLSARLLEEPGRVVLADAPFVEGAIAAAVAAGGGAALADVLAAAEEARTFRKL